MSSRRLTSIKRTPAGGGPARTTGRRAVGIAARLPGSALVGVVGYLTVLTVAAWRATSAGASRTPLASSPRHRFLVLIPAHNEEQLIGSTLKSLRELDYPEDLVAVHVVADNCTDDTAAIVRAFGGVEVHEHDDPAHGGKGRALQWLLGRLWQRGDAHDAVVFIDADTTVNRNFLRVVDARLTQGATAIQAYYAVRDPAASPVTAFRAAALAARHYLRPLGRNWLGGSAGLYGNGMVFTADIVRARQFTEHLTEDIEFQLELLLDGVRVQFAPDAVVEAEMPTTVAASQTQHERWEGGRLELARRFVPRLGRQAATGGPAGRFAYADAAIDQVVPPFSLVVAGTAAVGALTAVRAIAAPSARSRRELAVMAGVTVAEAAYVVSALRMTDAPTAVYRSLLGAPRLVAWKVGLWLRVLVRGKDVQWIRTARNPSEAGA